MTYIKIVPNSLIPRCLLKFLNVKTYFLLAFTMVFVSLSNTSTSAIWSQDSTLLQGTTKWTTKILRCISECPCRKLNSRSPAEQSTVVRQCRVVVRLSGRRINMSYKAPYLTSLYLLSIRTSYSEFSNSIFNGLKPRGQGSGFSGLPCPCGDSRLTCPRTSPVILLLVTLGTEY